MKSLLMLVLLAGLAGCQEPADVSEQIPDDVPGQANEDELRDSITGQLIQEAATGEHRSPESRARNRYRNPVETLLFFGLKPDMTVVEVWPGGGWYSEILAPVLRDQGRLIAAGFSKDSELDYHVRIANQYEEKLAAYPEIYGAVEIVPFDPPEQSRLGDPGSADMVLLSRHFHNFIRDGIVEDVLTAAREVLRDGGTLAIIQHRANPDALPESEQRTGYVRERFVIDQVTAAGFKLEGSSEINANPLDSADHPAGVWTLPPSMRYCSQVTDDQRAECEQKYRAIGESDRMTLKFSKH